MGYLSLSDIVSQSSFNATAIGNRIISSMQSYYGVIILSIINILLIVSITCLFVFNGKYKKKNRTLKRELELEKTAKDAIQEVAQAATLAKSDFLSNMSYEIREPLNMVIGMLSIGMSTGDIDKKNYYLDRADSVSKHLLGISNDILDMSRIEAKSFELSSRVFDFEKMLLGITNVISVKAEMKRQNFFVNLSRDVPAFIESDELRLSQVIINLVTNAIKFTQEKGSVTLSIDKVEETVDQVVLRVEVSDTGIGMSKEQQARILSPFNQANMGSAWEFGGTGLGIAISRHIVELMGGKLWIESELGKGTKFIFVINAKKLVEKPIKIENTKKQSRVIKHNNYNFDGHTILVAEDVEINREILSAILEETGIKIDFVDNGINAVSVFSERSLKYGLILMDINMPQMDGYEATRRIRALGFDWAEKIPILAMTTDASDSEVEKCVDSGVNDRIGKPIDSRALLSLLDKYLSQNSSVNSSNDSSSDSSNNTSDSSNGSNNTSGGSYSNGSDSSNNTIGGSYSNGSDSSNNTSGSSYSNGSDVSNNTSGSSNSSNNTSGSSYSNGSDSSNSNDENVRDMFGSKRRVDWTEGLISGNALMDIQHQRIFKLVSDLIGLCEEGNDVEKLYDTLAYLVDYTVQHFTDEEALQIEFDYPDYENHKQIHDEFKVTLNDLVRRYEESGASYELSDDVNNTIIRWLVYHIRHEDRKMGDFIRGVAIPEAVV